MKNFLLSSFKHVVSSLHRALSSGASLAVPICRLLILLSLAGWSQKSLGQTTIAGYNVSTVTAATSKTLAATTTGAGVIVTPLTQGTGVAGSNANRGFGGSGWTQNTAIGAISADKYLTFTVQATAGKILSLSAINPFSYKSTNAGPPSGAIQYSINGAAFTTIGSAITFSTTNTGASLAPIDLSGITALQNLPSTSIVTFRIVPYNASASGGTWYIYDTGNSTASDLSITGTVSACPTITATSLTGTTTICTGSDATLTATITGGTSPYSLTVSRGASGTFVQSGYVSGAGITVSPIITRTYEIVAATDANGCPVTINTSPVTVTVRQNPTTSAAGPSQTIASGSSATLAANTPSIGTGMWTVTSGPSLVTSQFSSTASPTATFTPNGGTGDYVLTWTISNAPCPASSSNVTITVSPPTCGTLTVPGNYSSIQAAINAACPGALIQVAAGTYTEQITIGKSLSIVGAGLSTIIQTPGTLVAGNLDAAHRNIIEINNGAAVTITGVNVNGPFATSNGCGDLLYGININSGAGLSLSNASVTNIYLTPTSLGGCQSGIGIRAGFNALGSPGSLTATNVTVSGYQKAGIIIDGVGATGTITNATVTGAGTTSAIAQNGIQISRGATGSVQSSTITGNNYANPNDPTTTATGLLAFDSGAITATGNSFSGNNIGAYAGATGPLTANNNTFSNNDYASIYAETAASFTGSGNTFDKQVTNNNKGGTVYSTIQNAIDDATADDVLTAAAGTFAEAITIDKKLTLNGANAGIDPNTGSRVPETIIVPATTGADYDAGGDNVVVTLTGDASGAILDGLTIDGNNPNLTGQPKNVVINGVDIDAATGISSYGTDAGNLTIKNNIVRNVSIDGIEIGGTATSTTNTIQANKFDNIAYESATTGSGQAIYLEGNAYANITNNVMTRVLVGVQTGNYYNAVPSGTPSISNNKISTYDVGIFHNLQYQSATGFTIANNTITADASLAATVGSPPFAGLLLYSILGTVPATLTNNTVGTGFTYGFDGWNMTSPTVLLSGGSVQGSTAGVRVRNHTGSYGDANASLTVSGVTITNSPVGVLVFDDPVAAAGNSASALVTNNTQITGSGAFTAVAISGPDASASITGNAASFIGNGSGTGVDVNGGVASVTASRVINFATGISVSNGGQLTNAANNFITGNTTGVAYTTDASPTQGTVTNNDLSGNTGKAITNGLASTTIGATCNWYGTTNVDGQAATLFTGAVTYSPYLNSGTDSDGNSNTGFQPVSGACVSNQPPVASTIGNQTATVGLAYSFTVPAFSDPENQTLTYTASIVPANGLSFDPATRVISGTPAVTGVSNVTVVATDPGSMSASQTFTITVNPVPCPQSVTNVTTGATYCTIQSAVDAATAGDVISVQAGTYAESVTIPKSLTILGAQAGVDPRSTGTTARSGGESVVTAPGDLTADGNLFTVRANNVVIDGFTLDGDNPAITGGTSANGADINARRGISTGHNGSFDYAPNGLTVQNNIIKNLVRSGIFLYLENQPANVAMSNVLATLNVFDNVGNFGVYAENNAYVSVVSNKITQTHSGIGIFSNGTQYTGTGTPQVTGNDITSDVSGLYYNNIFGAGGANVATPYSVADNTFRSTGTGNVGMRLYSLFIGGHTFTNNTATGTDFGALVWNTPGIGAPTISGGSLEGKTAAVRLTNYEIYDGPYGDGTTAAVVSGVSIANSPVGVQAFDDPAAAATQTSSVTVTGNTQITGSATFTAVAISGPDASASITGNASSFVGSNSGVGVDINGGSASVTANRITSFATGISVSNGGQLTSAANNFITGNGTGIAYAADANATQGVVTINDLSGNTTKAITNGLASTTITANCNWFGPSTATVNPTYVTGNVTTDQLLANGTDEQANTPGFQNTSCFTPPMAPVLTISPAPQLGPNTSYCIGDNPTVTSNYTTGTNSFTVQARSDGSTTVTTGNSVTITQGAGAYDVFATNSQSGYTSPVSATFVQIEPVVTTFVSSKAAYCVGETVSLTALGCNVTASSPNLYKTLLRSTDGSNNENQGTAFLPDGVTSYTYTQFATTAPITYTITAECVNGGTGQVCGRTQLVITANPLPVATLVSSNTLTCTVPTATLTAGGGQSYAFSGPGIVSQNGSATALVNASGTYSVTVTSAAGCMSTTTTTVTSDTEFPTATLMSSNSLNCAVMSATLTANASGGTSYTYTFSDGAAQIGATNQAIVTAGGSYSVTVTNANGCSTVATTSVKSDTAVPVATLVSSNSLNCSLTSATLTATSGAGYTYAFSSGASQIGNSNQATVTTGGSYSVTVTSASGCSSTAITTVASDTAVPSASLVASGTLTCAQTSVTLTANASGGSGYTYAFSPGASQIGNTNQATVTLAGSYSVTVTSGTGCSVVATVTVSSSTSVATPDFATRGNQAISDGLTSVTVVQNTTPVMFNATNCSGTLNWSGNGQTGTTTLNAPTSATGVFVYQATCTVGSCVSSPTSVTVTITPANTAPVPTANANQTATVGQQFTYTVNAFTDDTPNSLTYTASLSPANNLSFDPATRVISGTPMNTGVTSVTITATDPGGLKASTTFTITVLPVPVVTNLVVLQRDPDNGQLNTNTLKPYLQLQNNGSDPLPYSELRMRYWLTVENPGPLVTQVTFAQLGTDKVHIQYVAMPRQGATGYLEYSFDGSAGSLAAMTNSGDIQNTIRRDDYSSFYQGDDYSYVLNRDFAVNTHITAYRNGQLIFGTEPGPVSGGNTPLVLTFTANPTMVLTTGSTTLSASVSGGTNPYSYAFSGPGTINASGNTANVSGLSAGVQTFTVVVTDNTSPASQTSSATVSITVTTPGNQQPVATTNADQTATVGVFFTYTAKAFTDDTPNSLTYTASLSPANNLSFDPATRVISGTPMNTGVTSVTITATDPGGLKASTTFTITVLPVSVVTNLVVLQRDPDNGQLNTNTLKPYLQLQNNGSDPLPYSELRVRYWLTVENPGPLVTQVTFAQLGTDKVHIQYVAMPRQGATGYLEYSFDGSAGSLAAMTNSGDIQNTIRRDDYSSFYQGDDYSYVLNRDFAVNTHITAYRNGQLIFGTEPPANARMAAKEADVPLMLRVLGNPVSDVLEVEVTGAGGQALTLELIESTGRIVEQRVLKQAATTEQQRFEVHQQAAGVLLLRATAGEQTQSIKVLKK